MDQEIQDGGRGELQQSALDCCRGMSSTQGSYDVGTIANSLQYPLDSVKTRLQAYVHVIDIHEYC